MLTKLALFTQQKYITTCRKRPFLTVFTIPLDSLLMSQNASFGQDKNPLGSFQYTSSFQSMCKNVIRQIENSICRSDRKKERINFFDGDSIEEFASNSK